MKHANHAAFEDLLRQAGAAHGEYEETVLGGLYDEAWPAWYAQWLLDHGFSDLVGRAVKVGELSAKLAELHAAHQRTDGGQPWPAFYAERLAA